MSLAMDIIDIAGIVINYGLDLSKNVGSSFSYVNDQSKTSGLPNFLISNGRIQLFLNPLLYSQIDTQSLWYLQIGDSG